MKRDIGVDLIKFLAALLITNSHMGMLYGKYNALATGGCIGDTLFFFCSGFTLFLKPMGGANLFFNWYKRRINRIYPSVIAVAILGCVFFGTQNDILNIILHGGEIIKGGGWFIPCIMLYYIALFFVGVFFISKIWIIFVGVIAGTAFWFFSGVTEYSLYGDYIRWLLFFDFMLLGSKVGLARNEIKSSPIIDVILLFLSVIVFYAIFVASVKIESLAYIQFFSVFPLFGIMFYLYKVGSSKWIERIYNSKIGNFIIRVIGGLTLEIYLVQNYLFTDKMNHIFPLNILIMFVIIFVSAYIARCFSRILSQTFKDEPYNWNKVISMY